MSTRGGGRHGSHGGGGGAHYGSHMQHQPSHRELGGRGQGRGGGAPPPHEERRRASEFPESSSTTLSRELEERFHISGSSVRQAPTPGIPSEHPVAARSVPASVATGTSLPPASSKALIHAPCSGFGTAGLKCKVRINHFMIRAAEKNISQYKVFNQNPIGIYSRSPAQIENSLRELHRKSIQVLKRQNQKHKQLQLLIVVLPDVKGSYGRIKAICETELGLVTQCCQPKHVLKSNKQYLGNLALKINVKAASCNTVLEDAVYKRIPLISDAPAIIFGADVTHPAPGDYSSSSIAAV